MKITTEHYEALSALVSHHYTKLTAAQYRDAGLSYQRFLHDSLFNSKASIWICDNLYPYMNDDHLETALRRIARERGIVDWMPKATR